MTSPARMLRCGLSLQSVTATSNRHHHFASQQASGTTLWVLPEPFSPGLQAEQCPGNRHFLSRYPPPPSTFSAVRCGSQCPDNGDRRRSKRPDCLASSYYRIKGPELPTRTPKAVTDGNVQHNATACRVANGHCAGRQEKERVCFQGASGVELAPEKNFRGKKECLCGALFGVGSRTIPLRKDPSRKPSRSLGI